jgi:hypothetical protein
MTLLEFKNWINSLPEAFNEFTIVNGEFGVLTYNDAGEEEYTYRIDKPVIGMTVDEETKEIVIANEPSEPIDHGNV